MEVLVVGAGITGLACARALKAGGAVVHIVDRGRKPGGRCATRHVRGGQPVDYGPAFFHATDPSLMTLLKEVPATLLTGWPQRVVGSGAPCHTESFRPRVERFAFAEGLDVLPAFLAQDLDVEQRATVESVTVEDDRFVVHVNGTRRAAPNIIVMTAPPPQTLRMLEQIQAPPVHTVRAILDMVAMVPCLTSYAVLPLNGTDPGFDLMLPAGSEIVHAIAHDSSKRRQPAYRTIVIQALPAWSALRVDQPKEVWGPELVAAAAAICPALETPALETFHHRWGFARLDGTPTPAAPLDVRLGGGLRLAVAGEAFDASGGIEGAWRSGTSIARRLLEDRT